MEIVLEPGNSNLIHLAEPACFAISIDASDYQITPSSAAKISLTFKTSYALLPDGTPFKIWGYDFETAYNTTSKTFNPSTIGGVGAASFISMIRSNLNFANKVFTEFIDLGLGIYKVVISWSECGEQQNFTSSDNDFSSISSIFDVISVQNGVTGQNKENFRLVTSLQKFNGQNALYVSEFEASDVEFSCQGSTLTYIYPINQIRALLSTPMPELSPNSENSIESSDLMIGTFRLAFGSTYSENCVVQPGDIMFSNQFKVINAAFKYPNVYGMSEYTTFHDQWPPPGQEFPKALTTQPSKHFLCKESFAWLWYHEDSKILARNFRVIVEKKDATQSVTYTSQNVVFDYPIYNLNVSPQRVSSLSGVSLDNIKSYTVYLRDGNKLTHKPYEYILLDCACGYTDMYVLSEAGGFMTILVKIEKDEVTREHEELMLNVNQCFSDPKLLGSRTKSANKITRIRREIQVRPVLASKSAEFLRMLTDAAHSPVAYLKIDDPNGTPSLVRFVYENDKIAIGPKFSDSEFIFSGYLQDQVVQSQLK